MLKRVDRIQIAVRDAAKAKEVVTAVFGAEEIQRDDLRGLGAHRTTVQAGTSLIELLEPSGAGAVAAQLEKWGEGIFGAGFSVTDVHQAARHLERHGVKFRNETGQLFIDASETKGMRVVLTQHQERPPVGLIKWTYEVTNVVGNWKEAADRYRTIFDLDPSRFVPITSKEFGYTGSLLMFDSPARLDRIELSQIVEPEKAMGRFHRRRGDSLYMFYVETDNVNALADRLKARGGRFAGQTAIPDATGLFIHPTAFCGTLVGVSRTEHAWLWSGDEERARRAGSTAQH
jgi:catechol 2,3-dioxygenase-like lactoylglutathione lyase family enzyme